MRFLLPSPIAVQAIVCALVLGVLSVQPAAAGPVLLVPLGGALPAHVFDGARLVGAGPLPGSIIVTRAPAARDMTRFLVLAAPESGCGDTAR